MEFGLTDIFDAIDADRTREEAREKTEKARLAANDFKNSLSLLGFLFFILILVLATHSLTRLFFKTP